MTAISAACLLTGCATGPLTRSRAIAWDGLGRNPNLPYMARRMTSSPIPYEHNKERERVLIDLRPYSEAWWAVHDEIEAENDRQLSRKLVICHGCLTHPPSDSTGSISRQQSSK
ncbi:hypothetical protein DCG74_35550 [Bradyrhizobium sp. WBAH42]|nr:MULTISPECIES: hypothetical protein [unclassified Bradyrhizobium]NRB88110.1 hypothetical protein [Bradyrhizobium sp. WBAH10]QCJ94411.1 hypothetical protein DAA57_36985 [Bradyrhizobium yuanmingense]MDD1519209.1 hypothetical protein [Bradyrhizobium sp. WBAH30]MDD1543453.1 hypothetical protein [Bradyrhizobium sp. WBAH41]MDD1557583.1 hypothetical protein [Bradyrhizobium sp. WBAH23]